MCGVPHHAARGYIAKLTELGHKVVICEQIEDPKLAKGLVKREVVRVVTPGVVLDDESSIRSCRATSPRSCRCARQREARRWGSRISMRRPASSTPPSCAMSAVLDELVRVGPREMLAEALLTATAPRALRARYRVPWNAAPVPPRRGARNSATISARLTLAARPSRLRRCWLARVAGRRGRRISRTGRSRYGRRRPSSRMRMRPSRSVRCRSRKLIAYEPGDAVVLDEAAIANLELVETLIGRAAKARCSRHRPDGHRTGRAPVAALAALSARRCRADSPPPRCGRLARRAAGIAAQVRARWQIADLERLAGKATLGVAMPRDSAGCAMRSPSCPS